MSLPPPLEPDPDTTRPTVSVKRCDVIVIDDTPPSHGDTDDDDADNVSSDAIRERRKIQKRHRDIEVSRVRHMEMLQVRLKARKAAYRDEYLAERNRLREQRQASSASSAVRLSAASSAVPLSVASSSVASSLPRIGTVSRTEAQARQMQDVRAEHHESCNDYVPVRKLQDVLTARTAACRQRSKKRGSSPWDCMDWQHAWMRWMTLLDKPIVAAVDRAMDAPLPKLELAPCEACGSKMQLFVPLGLESDYHERSRTKRSVRQNPLTVTLDRIDASCCNAPYNQARPPHPQSNFALMHWICNRTKSIFDVWLYAQRQCRLWQSRAHRLDEPIPATTDVDSCHTKMARLMESTRQLLYLWSVRQTDAPHFRCHRCESVYPLERFRLGRRLLPGQVVMPSYVVTPPTCLDCLSPVDIHSDTDTDETNTIHSTTRPVFVSTIPPLSWFVQSIEGLVRSRAEWRLLGRVERGVPQQPIEAADAQQWMIDQQGQCAVCAQGFRVVIDGSSSTSAISSSMRSPSNPKVRRRYATMSPSVATDVSVKYDAVLRETMVDSKHPCQWVHSRCNPWDRSQLARDTTDSVEWWKRYVGRTMQQLSDRPRKYAELLCMVEEWGYLLEQVYEERYLVLETEYVYSLKHIRESDPHRWTKEYRSDPQTAFLRTLPPWSVPLISHLPDGMNWASTELELLQSIEAGYQWWSLESKQTPGLANLHTADLTQQVFTSGALSPLDKWRLRQTPSRSTASGLHVLEQYRTFLNFYVPQNESCVTSLPVLTGLYTSPASNWLAPMRHEHSKTVTEITMLPPSPPR